MLQNHAGQKPVWHNPSHSYRWKKLGERRRKEKRLEGGGEGVLYEMCDDLQLGRYGIS